MAIERVVQPFLPPEESMEEEYEIEVLEEGDEHLSGLEMEEMVEQPKFDDNLAAFMEEGDLNALALELLNGFEEDCQSRSDWEKTYKQGMDLLGLKFEDRTKPWAGATGVHHPLLIEAVVRFQAQTIQEIFPAAGPVKTSVVGHETQEVLAQAVRVAGYMNYVATKKMKEYREETERLLFCLPFAGSAFRKVYHDETLKRPSSMFVPPEDFVVAYNASGLDSVDRATHVMSKSPNWVRKMQVAGMYLDVELEDVEPPEGDIQSKIEEITGQERIYNHDPGNNTLLEMVVNLDLAGFESTDETGEPDGIALPYVVTVDVGSAQILRIRRNWEEDDPEREKVAHYAHYQYLPGMGFYGFGLVHMIGGLSKAATALLRQLIDAGTLSNLPGGLKSRGLRIKQDDSPIEPGEFRDVDVPMGAIKDNIAFLPYKEPSTVLYQLLGDLVQTGRQFASAADVKASDMNGEAPVGTTLAILEREMKVMSAVQARVHAAMGVELGILARVISDRGPENYPYNVDGEYTVRDDFDDRVDVIPVSDPNAGTLAQRIMQYQAALQLSAQAPQIYDVPFLHRQMIETLGLSEADRIIPLKDDMTPVDPVSENMAIIRGEPVRAFQQQDHEAHIQTHLSLQSNPQVMEMLGQHPNAKALQGAMADHIAEHVAWGYRRKIEEEMGMPMPNPEDTLPPDIEYRLSQLVAPAADQLTGKAQRMQKAEEDAQKQQDPIIQMQQQELAMKEKEISGKLEQAMMKMMQDFHSRQRKEDLDWAKLESQERQTAAQIAQQFASDMLKSEREGDKLAADTALRGFQIGVGVVNDAIDDGNVNGS